MIATRQWAANRLLGILGIALACGAPEPQQPALQTGAHPPPPPSGEPAAIRTLKLAAGAVTEEELAGGETHIYPLELAAGQYVFLVVDQRGVDVVVDLYAPDDRRLTRIDSPNSTQGPEPLHAVADRAVTLRLKLRAGGRAPPGRYAILVKALRPATARDRDRVAAERAFADAEALRRRPDATSRRSAIARYGELLASFRALGEHGRQADVLDRLGGIHCDLGEAARAVALYHEALPIFRELGQKLELGNALNSLGRAYRILGEPEKAIEIYREALDIHHSLGRRRAAAKSLGNLGRAYDFLGKVEEALGFYEQALEIQEELGDRAGAGQTLGNMGELYVRLGKRRQAREILERALALHEEGGRIRRTAITLTHLGRVYGDSGQPQKEVDYLCRALPMLQQVGARRVEAVTLNNLGTAYAQLGDAAAARTVYAKALGILRRLGDRHGEAMVLANLGWVRNQLGEPDAAVESYARAVPVFAATGDPDGEARALFGLAYAHRLRDELAASQAAIERALDRIEALRSEPASPQLRSVFLASKQEYYRFYVDLLMTLHQRHPAAGYHARAFEVSERARARSLLDLMAEGGAELRRGVDPALLAREAELGKRLNAAEQRRLWLQRDDAPADRLAAADLELRQRLAQWERLQAEIRRTHPCSLGVPASLREIQQQVLDERTLLVEYTLGSGRSFVWAVTPESVTCFELPPRAIIEATARRAHQVLANSHRALAEGQAGLALDELSRLLLAPVADHLTGERLLVIPDGALHYIPFAALPIPDSTPRPSTASAPRRPLIAEHEIVTLPSASTLAELRRELKNRRRPPATLAVLADPVFSATDPRLASRLPRPAVGATAAAAGRQRATVPSVRFQRLPFSRAEAEAILELVPAAERLGVLDFAAGRAILDQLGDYRMLHFATHGLFDSEHPELSGIVLSLVDDEGRPQEGYLRAHEIYRLDLPAELVVLSACQTALGPEVRGEGLVGLTRAFMVAGARCVAVSLWQVEDRATAELMERFYRRMLAEGRSPAAALRQAQLALRQHKGWEAPYYWAGFVLHGDWW